MDLTTTLVSIGLFVFVVWLWVSHKFGRKKR